MTFLAIAYEDGYRVYRTTDGRDRHYLGPTWKTPKAARTYLDTLEERHHISPVRASDEDPVVPPLTGSSPESLTRL